MRRGVWRRMRSKLTLTHAGFYLRRPKGFLKAGSSSPGRFVSSSDHCAQNGNRLLSRPIRKLRPSNFLQKLQNTRTSLLMPK